GTAGAEGDIWYNPIPEDEECQAGTRAELAAPGGSKVAKEEEDAQGGTGQKVPGRRGEEAAAGRSQACGKVPIPCITSGLPSANCSPPGTPRGGDGGGHSDANLPSQHRAKSPGTVRRISLKMKKLPELRRKLSLRCPRAPRGGANEVGTAQKEGKESCNVISRYHLDSSVGTVAVPGQGGAKAAVGRGYLSDGDWPKLPVEVGGASPEEEEEEEEEEGLHVALYQPYSWHEVAEGMGQRFSGLVNVHLRGLKELKVPKGEVKEMFCLLQVDSVAKARTALLSCRKASVSLNHTFNLELEGAERLKVVVFSWDGTAGKSRVCCQGSLRLAQIFRGCRAQQLAVQLQPRGVLYSKVTLVELWDNPKEKEPQVFGVDLCQLVEKEKTTPKVPLLVLKCVAEIEKRGLKVVGLYRLCGSAAMKRRLREAFEVDSSAVSLGHSSCPDINVVTGILKDFLRELPTPLITSTLYQVVLEAMARRPPRTSSGHTDATSLLDCLPEVQKATLKLLLDHLSLVASFHLFNRMNPQNLAVCFGPVLLNHHQ
ncbi:SYDE2 protein, partial [Eubucco bourcierii]|nr:SYDE2 protein [Eubucco bourcierii]